MGIRTVKAEASWKTIVKYGVMCAIALLMLIPFLWMISTSLKSPDALLSMPPEFLPLAPRFSNYTDVFSRMPIGLFFFNSLKISVLGTIGELMAASLAAYAFARMQFKGKNILYGLFLATMMVPFQITMIPVFMIIKWLGWMDSQASLIIPHFFGGAFASAAFGIFLLRQFFESIPKELEDASRIDGAGRFRFLIKVILPLSKPALGVLGLFVFMGIWNDLLSPVLFLSSEDKMPLPFGLATLQAAQHTNRYDLLMAGTLVSIIPIILFYILVQRRVSDAFLRTGIKG
ncbi:MAG: carbohydrate ABC transporter permease [Candidatus Kapaibacterium sp.]